MDENRTLYEVVVPLRGLPGEPLKYVLTQFPPDQYDREEDQLEAVLDYVSGCRFSDSEYYVFRNDKLIDL